jgi:hypothetical protein
MHSKHQTIASDSDQTWSQESDIRSLRAAEFEVIDESSTEDEDDMISDRVNISEFEFVLFSHHTF